MALRAWLSSPLSLSLSLACFHSLTFWVAVASSAFHFLSFFPPIPVDRSSSFFFFWCLCFALSLLSCFHRAQVLVSSLRRPSSSLISAAAAGAAGAGAGAGAGCFACIIIFVCLCCCCCFYFFFRSCLSRLLACQGRVGWKGGCGWVSAAQEGSHTFTQTHRHTRSLTLSHSFHTLPLAQAHSFS